MSGGQGTLEIWTTTELDQRLSERWAGANCFQRIVVRQRVADQATQGLLSNHRYKPMACINKFCWSVDYNFSVLTPLNPRPTTGHQHVYGTLGFSINHGRHRSGAGTCSGGSGFAYA